MVKNLEQFRSELKELREFLAAKKQLGELASRAKTSLSTVYDTFNVDNYDQITGKRLDVYREAINLVREIKSLPQQATDALKNE